MSRPGRKRKHVRVEHDAQGEPHRVEKGGTEIEGLSYDSSVKSYYTRVNGLKENLGRDLATAIAKLRGEEPVGIRVNLPAIILPHNERFAEDAAAIAEAARALVLANGSTRRRMIAAATATPAVPANETLSDCVEFWREWKEASARRPSYVRETVRVFQEFIAEVGDLPVNQVAQEHIVKFERYMIRESKTKRGNNWWALRIKCLSAVLNLCEKKTQYPLPPDWRRWVGGIDRKRVTPAKTAKKRLPVEIFQGMLATCQRDAEVDIAALPTATDSDNGKRVQAMLKKRQAVQWTAILRLTLQCSLDNQDVCDIQWQHIKLAARVPHIAYPRAKPQWATGQPIERLTPLLPSTVAALVNWRAFEKPTEIVFRNARKGKWVYDKLSRVFGQIKTASGHQGFWSFKHLRNVAPSLRKSNHLPSDMSDAILGHVLKTGNSKFYEDEVDERYLIPLVNLVGTEYFGGEQVATPEQTKS